MARGNTQDQADSPLRIPADQRLAYELFAAEKAKTALQSDPEILELMTKMPEDHQKWFEVILDDEGYPTEAFTPKAYHQIQSLISIGRHLEQRADTIYRQKYLPSILELQETATKLRKKLRYQDPSLKGMSEVQYDYAYDSIPKNKLEHHERIVKDLKDKLKSAHPKSKQHQKALEGLKDHARKLFYYRQLQKAEDVTQERLSKLEVLANRQSRLEALREVRAFGEKMDFVEFAHLDPKKVDNYDYDDPIKEEDLVVDEEDAHLGRILQRASTYLPADWWKEHKENKRKLTIYFQELAGAVGTYHRPLLGDQAGIAIHTIYKPQEENKEEFVWYQAGPKMKTQDSFGTVLHELCHHVEDTQKHIGRAGVAFRGYRRQKHGPDGNFANDYMNHEYAHSHNMSEVITMGIQYLFEDSSYLDKAESLDEEYRSFLMGILACA